MVDSKRTLVELKAIYVVSILLWLRPFEYHPMQKLQPGTNKDEIEHPLCYAL